MAEHDGKQQTATEQIVARDINALRKQAEAMRVLDILRRTVTLYAERPDDDEAVARTRVQFTDESARMIAPLIEAVDILWAIIYASDGCMGHRQCAHSMEPWQRARDLLYRKPDERVDDDGSPASIMRAHLDTFGAKDGGA